jgi:O-antigen/teichoic acid export membrane protein
VNRFHPARWLKSRLMKETATLQVSAMLNQGSQLFSSIVLAFLLGSHELGLYFLAISLQAVLYNLVNVGVVQATITQVAAASVRDSREKVAGWLAFLVKSNVVFSVLVLVVGWWALPAISSWWYDERLGDAEAHNLGRWAWYLSIWPLLDTPRVVAQVAFQGTRRMLPLGQLDNGQELMRALLVTCGAILVGSWEGAVLGEIASRVLASYMAMDMYRAALKDGEGWLPSMRDVWKQAPDISLASGMRLSLRIGFIKNVNVLFMDLLPYLMLGNLASASWVTYFRVASKIMGFPLMMLQGVTRTIVPALSEFRGLRDLAGFRRLFMRSSLISGLVVSSITLLMLPFVKLVVRTLWPADFEEPVFGFCWILGLGMIPIAFSVGLDAFYMLTDQMKTCLKIMSVGALITIPANVFLIWTFPETGAAWGQTVYRSYVIVHWVFVWWYFRYRAAQGHWNR